MSEDVSTFDIGNLIQDASPPSTVHWSRSMDLDKYIIWEPTKRCSHVPFEVGHYNSHFIPLKFISQNGPQCGFAALCMIASSADIQLCPDELVLLAKEKNITNHGEMFSALSMKEFAENLLQGHFEVTLISNSIKGSCYQLKKYLDDNNLVLIPYDCDFNNEPCLRNGTRAHWAVVCGYIDGGHEENFYVLACHGKSQFVSAWKFSELQLSNDNLNDLGLKRKLDDNDYVIPSGGLKTGIASKSILFKKINSSFSYFSCTSWVLCVYNNYVFLAEILRTLTENHNSESKIPSLQTLWSCNEL